MVAKDDWRRMGQETYLTNQKIRYVSHYMAKSPVWEHEHCCFCFAKISPYDGDLHDSYCTINLENEQWVCADCYSDFKDEFNWEVV